MTKPEERFLWLDVETFGLEIPTKPILEVGLRITGLDGSTLSKYTGTCWHDGWYDQLRDDLASANDRYVYEMHDKSGLWEEAAADGRPMDEIRIEVMAWMEANGLTREDPLCGSTVSFDRGMLAFWMPGVTEIVSHRNIDISTVKELCRRISPEAYHRLGLATKQQKLHRVQPDITDSINEFQYYEDNFLGRAS